MKLKKGMEQGWRNQIFAQFAWSTLPGRSISLTGICRKRFPIHAEVGGVRSNTGKWQQIFLPIIKTLAEVCTSAGVRAQTWKYTGKLKHTILVTLKSLTSSEVQIKLKETPETIFPLTNGMLRHTEVEGHNLSHTTS